MQTNKQDNIFPLTEQEILEHYPHVFNNQFQTRTIEQVWNQWTDEKFYNMFRSGYTKGHSTAAIVVTKQGEREYVEFWQYNGDYRNNYKKQYGYSFKTKESAKNILN